MGNHTSSQPSDAGKVILSNGGILELKQTTTAAELMLEHPQHVVVELEPSSVLSNDENLNEKKKKKKSLIPLPADKNLHPGKIYLMLPVRHRRSSGGGVARTPAISPEDARRVLLNATRVLGMLSLSRGGNYDGLIPWVARVFPAAGGQVAVAARKAPQWPEPVVEDLKVPEFPSRQLSGKGWKPTLDPIEEKKVKRKITRWLSY